MTMNPWLKEWNVWVELTRLERTALIEVLIDYYRRVDATQEFVDVATGQTINVGDLITILTSKARDQDGNYVGFALDKLHPEPGPIQ
jgi:hypothetical protein